MRLGLGIIVAAMGLVAIVVVALTTALPSTPLRIALGLPLVAFFPGFALVAALFPRKDDLGCVERIVVSLVVSMVVASLVGLLLDYTAWGIRLHPFLAAVALVVVVASASAWCRWRRLGEGERLYVGLGVRLSEWRKAGWDKALSLVLAASVLGTVVALAYAIMMPRIGERYTEFYILGPGGNSTDYPKKLLVGYEGRVIVGVVNNEQKDMTYRVEVKLDGETVGGLGPLEVPEGSCWEEEVHFVATRLGQDQKLEFLLYTGELADVYRELQLWLDVLG